GELRLLIGKILRLRLGCRQSAVEGVQGGGDVAGFLLVRIGWHGVAGKLLPELRLQITEGVRKSALLLNDPAQFVEHRLARLPHACVSAGGVPDHVLELLCFGENGLSLLLKLLQLPSEHARVEHDLRSSAELRSRRQRHQKTSDQCRHRYASCHRSSSFGSFPFTFTERISVNCARCVVLRLPQYSAQSSNPRMRSHSPAHRSPCFAIICRA